MARLYHDKTHFHGFTKEPLLLTELIPRYQTRGARGGFGCPALDETSVTSIPVRGLPMMESAMTMNSRTSREALYQEAAENHGHALERLARAYEMNPDRQRDLLQEIHLALWQSLEIYEGRCSLRTWVYRVAHNTAASHAVREHRKGAREWMSLESLESAPDPSHTAKTADRRLVLERLWELIHSLRPLDRQLVLLYLEEMDAESIGDVMGLSPGNVRVRIHRIKSTLASRFHGALQNE